MAEEAAARIAAIYHTRMVEAVQATVRDSIHESLRSVGLHDDDAGADVRDLRNLIETWRIVRKRGTTWAVGVLFACVSLALWPHIRSVLG